MWLYNACISVWKLQNSKHFNLVQKSSRYLKCNKSYVVLHRGAVAQNASQIPVRAQGFVGSPPHPGYIMSYSYHQMFLALNSKPYWSNKQVLPLRLLFWCPRLPRKPSGDMWESNLLPTQFWVRFQARNLTGKNCCTFATLHDLK